MTIFNFQQARGRESQKKTQDTLINREKSLLSLRLKWGRVLVGRIIASISPLSEAVGHNLHPTLVAVLLLVVLVGKDIEHSDLHNSVRMEVVGAEDSYSYSLAVVEVDPRSSLAVAVAAAHTPYLGFHTEQAALLLVLCLSYCRPCPWLPFDACSLHPILLAVYVPPSSVPFATLDAPTFSSSFWRPCVPRGETCAFGKKNAEVEI